MVQYECNKCGKKFTRKSSYDNHLSKKKLCGQINIDNLIVNNNCKFCNKQLSNKYSAIRHAKQCNDKEHIKNTLTIESMLNYKKSIPIIESTLNYKELSLNHKKQLLNEFFSDPLNNDLLDEFILKRTNQKKNN